MEVESALDRAIRAAGGVAKLAALLGESSQTVSNWRTRKAPANRCSAIEQHTGVSRRELRPDDWRDYWPALEDTLPAPTPPNTPTPLAPTTVREEPAPTAS